MARVFTTEFDFENRRYRAIVAVKNEDERTIVHLRLFDPELIAILGQHSIDFVGLSGYKQLAHTHPLALSLLETINKAIVEHLLQ